MDLPYGNRTEEYYKKFIELQEKLRKSEEERLKLEMKFNEMVQTTKEETQNHYRKLRTQYKRFLEEDRRRQERNERILRTLDRIESRVAGLRAKTDRFSLLRQQYQTLLQRMYYKSAAIKPTVTISQPAEEKSEILEHYIRTLSTPKVRDFFREETASKRLGSDSEINETRRNNSSSIADDIMNSIYERNAKYGLGDDGSSSTRRLLKAPEIESDNNHNEFRINDLKTRESDVETDDESSDKDIEKTRLQSEEIEKLEEQQNEKDNINLVASKKEIDTNVEAIPIILEDLQARETVINSNGLKIEQSQQQSDGMHSENKLVQENDNRAEELPENVNNNEIIINSNVNEVNEESLEKTQMEQTNNDNILKIEEITDKELPDKELVDSNIVSVQNVDKEQSDQLQNIYPTEYINEQPKIEYSEDIPSNADSQQVHDIDELPITELDSQSNIVQEQYLDNIPSENQPQQYYDESGTPLSQYPIGEQPDLTYTTEQPINQEYSENIEYDENGQPINYNNQYEQQYPDNIQYDENGQMIQQYNDTVQYDENGQPLQPIESVQYDENGQYIGQYNDEYNQNQYQYDENGQLIQYDENGQPIQYYGQYDENGQIVEQYPQEEVETKINLNPESEIVLEEPTKEEIVEENVSKQNLNPESELILEEPAKEEIVEENISETDKNLEVDDKEKEPNKLGSNVLNMLDTDTESIKQDTKVSNDSDFDFSNT